eukprot:450511-Prorocentrum_minimum.AAC.2
MRNLELESTTSAPITVLELYNRPPLRNSSGVPPPLRVCVSVYPLRCDWQLIEDDLFMDAMPPSRPPPPSWTFVPLTYCTTHPKDAPGIPHY